MTSDSGRRTLATTADGPRSHFFFLVVHFAFFGTYNVYGPGLSAQDANKLAICRHMKAQRSFEGVR